MTDAEKIDAALREIRGRDATRGQQERERYPGWYERSRPAGGERSDRGGDWGGGNFSGRNWGGGRER